MSTMVERVARAICEADCGRITDNELDRCRELARAAIEAMMEPTQSMFRGANDALVPPADASACWRAMVQAALKESA